ncbi:MAG: ATP-dependent DNA ligase [Solirubrobacteraceae bacterium]
MLPLAPPFLPQLARSAKSLPEGDGWAYEPKWDGFRAIVFVDGDEVTLQSRNGKPLTRYFPELHGLPAGRYVIDGEIVIRDSGGREDFDALSQRIHPAKSRIDRLAEETPARLIAFDLLARDDEVWIERALAERRVALTELIGASPQPPLELTPFTLDVDDAQPWLQNAEGVIAKELAAPYLSGERKGMVKIKRVRTSDCVVKGWRSGKEEGTVGSLILGLYGEDGRLAEVGHSSGFTAKEKRAMVERLAPYETGERGIGEPSRWKNDKDLEWIILRPELVVEITFDHTSGRRIRHGAKVQRWREDKDPRSCTIDQLLS